jgi:phosphate transport system permease protein
MNKQWFKRGEHWVWLNAGALSTALIMVIGLLVLITIRGMSHFWPANVEQIFYTNSQGQQEIILGEISDTESKMSGDPDKEVVWIDQTLLKIGNRDVTGLDFRWILDAQISQRETPREVMVLERTEWGNFYGFPQRYTIQGERYSAEDMKPFYRALGEVSDLLSDIKGVEKFEIGHINQLQEKLRREQRALELANELTAEKKADLDKRGAQLQAQFETYMAELSQMYQVVKSYGDITMRTGQGVERVIPMYLIVHAFEPNSMGTFEKLGHYFGKIWEFLSADPREANTEGGVFPAIFGTVMMVFIMTIIVTPFGVVAAIYLREYAKQGPVVRTIRIAVNNLAGVPSIVFGVFGLGFFVYFLGGNIDDLFFQEGLPSPTFGTPGILWASLTLALLTLPVVIVSTEEGLSRIPSAIREGSLALGATKSETILRTILPMASPAIMTGLILAIARAAGEVAPLMLVGVVKLAPDLVVDLTAPFIHLERKFMHLGFHIYDVGFQSPNVEAARPLVYATSLLLVLVIIALNLVAIYIRNRLREKYKSLEH